MFHSPSAASGKHQQRNYNFPFSLHAQQNAGNKELFITFITAKLIFY